MRFKGFLVSPHLIQFELFLLQDLLVKVKLVLGILSLVYTNLIVYLLGPRGEPQCGQGLVEVHRGWRDCTNDGGERVTSQGVGEVPGQLGVPVGNMRGSTFTNVVIYFLPSASLLMTLERMNRLLLMYPVSSVMLVSDLEASSSLSLSLPARSTRF